MSLANISLEDEELEDLWRVVEPANIGRITRLASNKAARWMATAARRQVARVAKVRQARIKRRLFIGFAGGIGGPGVWVGLNPLPAIDDIFRIRDDVDGAFAGDYYFDGGFIGPFQEGQGVYVIGDHGPELAQVDTATRDNVNAIRDIGAEGGRRAADEIFRLLNLAIGK